MDPSIAVAVTLVVAAVLSFELNISSAILEVASGVLLALWLGSDLASLGWLEFLANLGMLGLMFMAGFEVDSDRLRETWKASVAIGACSLAAPFAGVFLVAYFVLGLSPLAAGLVAVALSTTSLALVFHALKERGLLQRRMGQTVLAAASVVDVLSMIVLALLLGEVGWGTAVFLLVVIPTLISLPQIGRWIFWRYHNSLVELELRFVLVLLVAIGSTAEEVGGIHPAIVAFALGLVLSEVVDSYDEVEYKLKGIAFSFFASILFLHAGTQFEP
jgi:Kef-type K+ transport system membrane component KefB